MTHSSALEPKCEKLAPRLPANWNASFGSHSFLYAHSQSSMQYIMKIDRMGSKAEIRALGVGDEKIHRFEVTARDFISSGALPVRIPFSPAASGSGAEKQTEDRSPEGGLHDKLRNVFISETRIKDLASLFRINIIQRIIPRLLKEGYEETEDDRQAMDDARSEQRRQGRSDNDIERRMPEPPLEPEPALPQPYPNADPLAGNPTIPPTPAADFPPPGWEDPLDMNRPIPSARSLPPPHNPLGIGHDDLNPPGLGPYDPLRGAFIPGHGSGSGSHGGMHPTFEDPLFQGPRRGGNGESDFDSQVPPGARWDPVGPNLPGFGRRRPGGGGGSFNPFNGGGFGGFRGGFI